MTREEIAEILWIHFPDAEMLQVYDAADALKKVIIQTFGPPF